MKSRNNKIPIIKIKNLKKSFGDKHILNGFNLELYEGESLVIMGKSGAGKSVMIKCLVGLMKPDSGTVEVMGKDINKLSQNELNNLRTKIGFLFQGGALYDSMTVRENLEFPLRKTKDTQKDKDKLALEVLKSVDLPYTLNLMPSELSGGMSKRIALARAIIVHPKILIYDEPTTGLDPLTSKEITELMVEVQKEYKSSSLIITHDISCARVASSRIIILIDGFNYIDGTFKELSSSNDEKIQVFFK